MGVIRITPDIQRDRKRYNQRETGAMRDSPRQTGQTDRKKRETQRE